ncbi:MAG: pantoate--beta-alanine ligase [Nitrospinae bacterium]|nr:pantoate--beta-alanine ligase [Nitrospinota bacterium]
MKIITSIKEMHQASMNLRSRNNSIGFVPTMGALHKGHVHLIERARSNNTVILSIFVNPKQFAPGEDYNRYPRYIEKDKVIATDSGVDILFLPSTDEIYPEGYKTFVNVEGITDLLCGRFRPGHFKGVATVVLKLFNIVMPHRAYFGEKDYQQMLVIKSMVRDLNLDIEIFGIPIVRDDDGLAMSSRNVYLGREERVSATSLNRALKVSREMVKSGEMNAQKIISEMERIIKKGDGIEIDYISLCNPETLEDIKIVDTRVLVAMAVRIGGKRLIDNCIVEVK